MQQSVTERTWAYLSGRTDRLELSLSEDVTTDTSPVGMPNKQPGSAIDRYFRKRFPLVCRYAQATSQPVLPLVGLWMSLEKQFEESAYSPSARFMLMVQEFKRKAGIQRFPDLTPPAQAIAAIQYGMKAESVVAELAKGVLG